MGRLRFVLSQITRENDSQREGAKAAEAAAQRLNVDLEVVYAEGDSVRQSSQILDALHKYKSSLSGILVLPAGGTDFPQIGRAAASAGVAWVLLNRDANSLQDLRRHATVPVFAVSANHTDAGRIQARQLAALLPEGGLVLCVQGPSGTLAARERLAGLQEVKARNLELKIIKSTSWTEEGGRHAMASWLRLSTSLKQTIHAVAAQNDVIAMGARKAIGELASHWSKLPFLGVGGQVATGRVWVNEGLLTATVVVPPVAGLALDAAVAGIAQKKQPPDLQLIPVTPYPAITTLKPVSATQAGVAKAF